jgi:hypothetical protein
MELKISGTMKTPHFQYKNEQTQLYALPSWLPFFFYGFDQRFHVGILKGSLFPFSLGLIILYKRRNDSGAKCTTGNGVDLS